MKKYNYTPKPLFYIMIASIIVSLFFAPIGFIVVLAGWFMYAFIVFCNSF